MKKRIMAAILAIVVAIGALGCAGLSVTPVKYDFESSKVFNKPQDEALLDIMDFFKGNGYAVNRNTHELIISDNILFSHEFGVHPHFEYADCGSTKASSMLSGLTGHLTIFIDNIPDGKSKVTITTRFWTDMMNINWMYQWNKVGESECFSTGALEKRILIYVEATRSTK